MRSKLVGLLAAFAAFSILTTAATVYGIQWHVNRALLEFERTLGADVQVDRLHWALKEQMSSLREVVRGRHEALEPYFTAQEEFFSKLRQVAVFAHAETAGLDWPIVLQLAQRLREESDRCVALAQESQTAEAQTLLAGTLEAELVPALNERLLTARAALDILRSRTTRRVGAASSQVLLLTSVVAGISAVLVIVGVLSIRQWLFVPIAALHLATERFSRGELGHRVSPTSHDELGVLGSSLNEMARSLTAARAELQASEAKYRRLFENLRDAVIVCTESGEIVEYHDSDTRLLGVEGSGPIGRRLLEVWPAFDAAGGDWPTILEAAVAEGRRYRAVDVELASEERRAAGGPFVDFFVYRVEYGRSAYAAVVVRDVTERQRLQRKVRHGETMEAVGTMAGGLAHDFNNLLTGVIGSLSLLAGEIKDSPQAQRLQSVIRSCWQAAGLSRRLLNFAGSAHGDPQPFCVRDAVTVILDSMDPSFLEGVDLQKKLECPVSVRMDRDQFTQIVLNLLRNARDAMPDGGTLCVELTQANARDPDGGRVETAYAVLLVQDTGVGMTREVQGRIFDPFFTTKSRASRRGRGMGMAIAHTAVRNAGGFIGVESRPGHGTSFQVYLPEYESGAERPTASLQPAKPARVDKGTILLVEEDAAIRDVGTCALQKWGYAVLAAEGNLDARAKLAAAGHGCCVLAVIDMVLSDGDSLELAEHVVSVNSNVGIILTTAEAEKPVPSHLEPYIRAHLLKPFHLDALANAVSAALPRSTLRA